MARQADKFYTRAGIAAECVSAFRQHVPVADSDVILEPSAGSGSFLAPLSFHANVRALDILPEGDGIEQGNFLEYAPPQGRVVHVVGNPPFGACNKLSRAFVRHACSFAASVSFILPISWSKATLQKTFPLDFHLAHAQFLPEDAFTFEGRPFKLPCVFQVWVRRADAAPRLRPPPVPTEGYRFVREDEEADIAIRCKGYTAGRVLPCTRPRHHTRRYVRADSPEMLRRILLAETELRRTPAHTAGPRIFSMDQIATVLNKYTKI
jgi:hypothetical protein